MKSAGKMINRKFGTLTVLEFVERNRRNRKKPAVFDIMDVFNGKGLEPATII